MASTEEGRKIRESRLRSMKGSPWTKFLGVFESTAKGVYDGASKGIRRTSISSIPPFPKINVAKSA
jgi:hypothetical protein